MRLWSIHPKYLDRKGLVALWREALLAQKVLKGETKGYTCHPQLERFRNHPTPDHAIADYLSEIWKESKRRGYRFDGSKIAEAGPARKMTVTRGQLRHEFNWLLSKLECRDCRRFEDLASVTAIDPHPLFEVVPGGIEDWEKTDTRRRFGR